jgi:Ca-activated chloride channel homolog
MHPRNSFPVRTVSRIVSVVVAVVILQALAPSQASPAPAAQTSQGGATTQQTPASGQPSTTQPSTGQTPSSQSPSSSSPAAAPAAQPAPAGQEPASGQQAPAQQPPADQAPPTTAPPPAAESPSSTDNGVFVFRKEVAEVTLHATVVDERNRLITNLDRNAFSIFENDHPQQISSFRREDYPVAMGIVIDNSGSMRDKRDEVNKAALNLVRSSNPKDQVFVVNFNDEYYLDQEFTSDIKKLQTALEKVESRGGTALYDAIVASWTDELSKSPLQRKVIFVVTDGEDDASQLSLEQAMHTLQQENGPVVYAIGLLGDEKARKAKRALQLISDRTGGIAFFPPTLGEVDEISRTVARDIRNQYTITYAPTTPKTVPGFRAVRVDAHAKPYKRLSVRTRAGYYPGQEQQKSGGGE